MTASLSEPHLSIANCGAAATQYRINGRIDLMGRVKEGTISVLNGNEAVLAEIARAIPHADWVYHHLDYI